jgi:hypothetical protein
VKLSQLNVKTNDYAEIKTETKKPKPGKGIHCTMLWQAVVASADAQMVQLR